MANSRAWISFWILGVIWGSSFLLIRVGVEEVSATQLVLIRIGIAAIGLNAVRYYLGHSLPRDWPTIRAFIIIGIGNATIPFTLISLSEQNITSGNAAVLQATASLFTLITAHFTFEDERINTRKIVGLAVGFCGIVVLSSRSFDGTRFDTPMLLGQLGMMAASLCYAIFTVYGRKFIRKQIEPIVVSSGTFIFSALGAAVAVVLEPIFGGRSWTPVDSLTTEVLLAVLGLGFLNTFIAYLFFYYIVKELGAFRASMVTYIVPAVGLILGWLVLDEQVDALLLLGAALIFAGIAIVNLRFTALFKNAPRLAKAVPQESKL